MGPNKWFFSRGGYSFFTGGHGYFSTHNYGIEVIYILVYQHFNPQCKGLIGLHPSLDEVIKIHIENEEFTSGKHPSHTMKHMTNRKDPHIRWGDVLFHWSGLVATRKYPDVERGGGLWSGGAFDEEQKQEHGHIHTNIGKDGEAISVRVKAAKCNGVCKYHSIQPTGNA